MSSIDHHSVETIKRSTLAQVMSRHTGQMSQENSSVQQVIIEDFICILYFLDNFYLSNKASLSNGSSASDQSQAQTGSWFSGSSDHQSSNQTFYGSTGFTGSQSSRQVFPGSSANQVFSGSSGWSGGSSASQPDTHFFIGHQGYTGSSSWSHGSSSSQALIGSKKAPWSGGQYNQSSWLPGSGEATHWLGGSTSGQSFNSQAFTGSSTCTMGRREFKHQSGQTMWSV